MFQFIKNKMTDIGFVLLLIICFYFLNFHSYFFAQPQGVHFNRQIDGLSFVSNYYHNGFDFFHPELYNLIIKEARGVSEFPIFYYITSLLYLLFGEKEFILKLIHLSVFSVGLFHLYKLTYQVIEDKFYAYIIPLFLFSSVSLTYYAFNFLPDIAALGFSFSGWYFVIKYRANNKFKLLIYAFVFFTFSALLKVTFFINPFAFFIYCLADFLFFKKEVNKKEVKRISVVFSGTILILIFWNSYVFWYNAKYNSTFFLTKTTPFWELTRNENLEIWGHIKNEWYKKYLAESSLHFLLIVLAFAIFNIKKIDLFLKSIFLLILIGTSCYFALFYSQFKYHDYYFLLFFPLLFFLLLIGFKTIKIEYNNAFFSLVVKLSLIIITISGINYSRIKVKERYDKGYDIISRVGFEIRKNQKDIDLLNIPENSKIIVAPDKSMNGGGYFLKRKFWPIENENEITKNNILKFRNKGARYIVIVTFKKEYGAILNQMGTLLLQNGDFRIYKL